MQIDYICLSRVFLEDLAGAFGLPRSQEFALLADLNVGGEPEVRHCGGIRKPAMTPRRQSKDGHRGHILLFHISR